MDAKVLFYAIPDSTQEVSIATGVPSGLTWIVSKIYMTNVSEETATITIKHDIDSTSTLSLLNNFDIDSNKTHEFGPIVINEGQQILAIQNTEDAIELIAYGYEENK